MIAPAPVRTHNLAVPQVQVGIEQSEYSTGQGSPFEELEARFTTLQRQVSETIRVLRETHKMEYLSPKMYAAEIYGADQDRETLILLFAAVAQICEFM